jgi:uncharacterized protein (TIRG00374 family)
LKGSPKEVLKLSALAIGYWAFDVLCPILMFEAMGVPASPLVLIVSYGVATTVATIPLTPGGIGLFETTMLATLVDADGLSLSSHRSAMRRTAPARRGTAVQTKIATHCVVRKESAMTAKLL